MRLFRVTSLTGDSHVVEALHCVVGRAGQLELWGSYVEAASGQQRVKVFYAPGSWHCVEEVYS